MVEIRRRPDGTPLRVLAAIAYATSPATLTVSQITAVRQVLTRLAARGEIIAQPGLAGVKLWRTTAAAAADPERRRREAEAKAKAERMRTDNERHRQYARWRAQQRPQSPRSAAAEIARRAIFKRAAKLLGMLGSPHDGERLAAARALEALRRRHKIDWTDLLVPHGP
jgi:hypothetical protein